jgi:hypothetical protein
MSNMAAPAKNVVAKFDAQLIATLFRLADEDRDGAIAGGEAVKFFLRSGLSQECLGQVREGGAMQYSEFRSATERLPAHFQIWELSSGGAAKLSTPQFGAALNLVSLAQVRAFPSMHYSTWEDINERTYALMPSG